MASHDQSRLTTVELLTALRQMSNLTSLELRHALALPKETTLDLTREPIPLPSLTTLLIETNDFLTMEILGYLMAPNVNSIYLACDTPTKLQSTDPIIPVYSMLPQHTTMWRSESQVSLKIHHSGARQSSVEVKIWRSSGDDERSQPAINVTPRGQPLFRLTLRGVGDLRTERHVCDLLPETEMSILDFSADIHGWQRNLATRYALPFFRDMKGMQCLHVRQLADLVLILSDIPKKPKARQVEREPYALPSLKRIMVDRAGYMKEAVLVRLVSKLKRLFEARKKWGFPEDLTEVPVRMEIRELCQVDKEALEPIADVVRL